MVKFKSGTRLDLTLGARSYPIYIGQHLLRAPNLLSEHVLSNQVLIVSNQTVAPLYLNEVVNTLADFHCDSLILPDGEIYKDLSHIEKIIDTLVDKGHHRDTTLLALGGGVIGDMTGFAAACYQRGVHFIQCPTSLLAQVDASVGGKTGVNHKQGKNLIGAFYQPQAVIIDLNTLKTLPEREFKSGLAEVIKYGMLADADFFSWLEKHMSDLLNHSPEHLEYVIKRCCEIKAEMVVADEREAGQRALLNLGHTFGHAIETLTGYRQWLHGEAVAMGLYCAAILSKLLGHVNDDVVKRTEALLLAADLPCYLEQKLDAQKILALMYKDKKVKNKKLHLIALGDLGRAYIDDSVSEKMLLSTLEQSKKSI